MKKYKTGAGVIVYKIENNVTYILSLEGPLDHQKRLKGKWDFPKGIIENEESTLDCAIRETFEEADYMVSKGDIISGPFQVSKCFMYLAPYDNIQIPKVKRNPMTGILEHQNCQWVSVEKLSVEAYDWLRPFVSWATSVINAA